MRAEEPPRIATWLLRQCAASERDESLVGDLLEEYQRRRSGWWYWRQTLLATALTAVHDFRVRRWWLVRAVVTGFATFAGLAWVLKAFAFDPAVSALPSLSSAAPQWLPRPSEVVLTLLMCAATFSSGWIVASAHRAHRIGAMCAYFGSFLLYGAVLVAIMPGRMPDRSHEYNFWAWMIVVMLYAASILIGWIYATRREDHVQPTAPG